MHSRNLAERREHTRALLDIILEVCLLTDKDSDGDFSLVPCRARDISGGGLSFYAKDRYPPEALLRLRIPLDSTISLSKKENSNLLKVMGKVMWCKRNGEDNTYITGVQFLNIYEQDYHLLKNYVLRLLKN